MNDDFRHQCRRRPTPLRPPASWPVAEGIELVGAGSGGGETVYGSQTCYFQGHWAVGAGAVLLYAMPNFRGTSLGQDNPSLVLAAVSEESKGRAALRGNQGVRISSGPPNQPPLATSDISGIEMQTGDEQTINIMRGMDPWNTNQRITLAQHGISIHCGTGQISLDAAQEILLQVAGGTSSISLTTAGIVLKGPNISIN
jgi:hypothetical protein